MSAHTHVVTANALSLALTTSGVTKSCTSIFAHIRATVAVRCSLALTRSTVTIGRTGTRVCLAAKTRPRLRRRDPCLSGRSLQGRLRRLQCHGRAHSHPTPLSLKSQRPAAHLLRRASSLPLSLACSYTLLSASAAWRVLRWPSGLLYRKDSLTHRCGLRASRATCCDDDLKLRCFPSFGPAQALSVVAYWVSLSIVLSPCRSHRPTGPVSLPSFPRISHAPLACFSLIVGLF